MRRTLNTARLGIRGLAERTVPYWPVARIRALQERRLRSILRHAYRTVPFYREAMRDKALRPEDFQVIKDLQQLPLIDGHDLQERPEAFISDAYHSGNRVPLYSTGSASSGPKVVHWNPSALLYQGAYAERDRVVLYHLLGKTLGLHRVSFISSTTMAFRVGKFISDRVLMPRGLVQTEHLSVQQPYEQIVERLNDIRPDVVFSYSSFAEHLFRVVEDRGLPFLPPKVWVCGADWLSPEGRKLIEETFHCRVHSTYQSVEGGRIAFQCELRHGFHVNEDLCPVRLVDEGGDPVPPGEPGEVVLSNLYNRAMVLLNYRLGDRAVMADAQCPCGRSLPLMRSLDGRCSDTLVLSDGREVLDHVLIEACGEDFRSALQFQFAQIRPGRFEIRVVPYSNVDTDDLRRRLLTSARSVLGDEAKVQIRCVERLAYRGDGKLPRVLHLD